MNNEPVAWMSQGGDVSRSKRYFEELGFTDLIPLQPVKELTDDGDAFRLAVRLKIEVYYGNDEGDAVYAGYYTPENTGIQYCIEYYDDITHMGDACSATRRAIVRAATEIEKTNSLRKTSDK